MTPGQGERQARFLSALTHELRTPLGSILMLSEMIMGSDGSNAVSRAEKIHGLAQDLRTLLDEVGELARLGSGRARITLQEVRSQALVEAIERALAARTPASRQLISSTAAALPPVVRTDSTRVLRVLDAVVTSMAEGDGDPIALRFEPSTGGMLAIRLLDTGDASPSAELDRLFEPFGAPSLRTSRAHGGQSLKLAIAHRTARLLGGRLVARSVSAGTELSLLLPVAGPPAAA